MTRSNRKVRPPSRSWVCCRPRSAMARAPRPPCSPAHRAARAAPGRRWPGSARPAGRSRGSGTGADSREVFLRCSRGTHRLITRLVSHHDRTRPDRHRTIRSGRLPPCRLRRARRTDHRHRPLPARRRGDRAGARLRRFDAARGDHHPGRARGRRGRTDPGIHRGSRRRRVPGRVHRPVGGRPGEHRVRRDHRRRACRRRSGKRPLRQGRRERPGVERPGEARRPRPGGVRRLLRQ